MRKKIEQQMNFSDHNFQELGEFFPPNLELEKISSALDENPAILELVARDLCGDRKHNGAEGMTVEQVLRTAVIYMLEGYSYRELQRRLSDSYSFRKFTRFGAATIPNFASLEKVIKRIRPETWEQINDLMVSYAIKKKVEDGKKLRVDTTVTETNIHYPTDAGLLWDSVRVLDRLMQGCIESCPGVRFVYHNRTRAVKKYSYKITMVKGPRVNERRQGWYRKLLPLVRDVQTMARGCREALAAYGVGLGQDMTAAFFRRELDHYLPLTKQVIEQCERRVLLLEKVPAGEKTVSIFEEHTDIICRGKTMSPVEFGHKLAVTTGDNGLITQFAVLKGNPSDSDLLAGFLNKHLEQFGAAPRSLAGDRRFYSAANEELAHGAPYHVEQVSIPKPGRRSAERQALESEGWFKKLQRFRAGIEGNLATLLNYFQLGRCLWRGFESFRAWVGLSILTYNLRKIAALT